LPRLRDIMLESAEGRKILKHRPRINSNTIDLEQLARYPDGTFGRAYVTWLDRCGVTPDTREPVSSFYPKEQSPQNTITQY
jgi:ubiquinone biosynthesis protein COQ4